MKEVRQFKEQILKEYPRLDKNAEFSFGCHPGVPCFNACCHDVNIFLTPYDVIRLKNRLGISSEEFLAKYTIMPFDKNLGYPVVMFKMTEDEKKACQFVGDKGCSVYEDRPWACRMYPLGLASPSESNVKADEEFYFLLQDPVCKGFDEKQKFTVTEWMDNQGVTEYDEMGREYKDITLHPFFTRGQERSPKGTEMFFTVCYNIDKFRKFVLETSFLRKFIVDDATVEEIKTDDIALLRFGYQWLRFSMFGEETMKIKPEIAEDKEKELRMKRKLK
jgi:Fe-S-cluster containining protein